MPPSSGKRAPPLVLSRQNLPHQQRDKAQLANIQRGGYGLKKCVPKGRVVSLDLILIATGSEVGLAMDAAAEMEAKSHGTCGLAALYQHLRRPGC